MAEYWVAFMVFLWAWVPTVSAQPSGFEEGEWEIRVKMKIEGAPFALPEQTIKQCITIDQMVPRLSAPGMEEEDGECSVIRQDVSGKKVTFEYECKMEEGVTRITGEMIYSGEGLEGWTQVEGRGGDMDGVNMSYELRGKRLGPCPE